MEVFVIKVVDIKKLPVEFDFKSNLSPFGILYHAIETKHNYKVTCDINDNCWNFSKEEMRRRLFNNDYTIVTIE